MSFTRSFLAFAVSIPMLVSCGDATGNSGDSIKDSVNSTNANLKSPDFSAALEITVKTFEVKDSTGKSKGWGYDLYVDGKRTISQPIIPAVSGNDAFATEDDAKKTGELAVKKMKMTGSFPTISIDDLDSLGIKHQ